MGFPLSTKSQMPSPTAREPRRAIFLHPEGEKDMLSGTTLLIDGVMCLPDSPSGKDLRLNWREFVYLISHSPSSSSGGSPHMDEVRQRGKDWAM